MNPKKLYNLIALLFIAYGATIYGQSYPYSDPQNTGNWVLNTAVSDEFNANTIDEDQWYIVGKFVDGKPVYIDPDNPNKNVWIGRAPSQFSGRNYHLNNGILHLEARWEPDFPFTDTTQVYNNGTSYAYENITTPCFIGRREFEYGYMEIRSKAADAEITSSFWLTGNNAELDVFEMFGDHRQPNKAWRDQELWWSIHDWRPGAGGKSVYTEHHDLGFRVADDYHIYGFDWTPEGIKYYIDGVLFRSLSKEQIDSFAVANGHEKGWMIDGGLKIWLDMETFPWHGVPDNADDLTLNGTAEEKANKRMEFLVDYVRVWQKGDPNLIDSDFHGFEAHDELEWWINAASKEYMTIGSEKVFEGDNALKFEQNGELSAVTTAFAPFEATKLEAGTYTFSMQLFVETNEGLKTLRIVQEDPWVNLDFDLSTIEKGKWVELSQTFTRETASGTKDRTRIQVRPEFTNNEACKFYIDNLMIVPAVQNSTPKLNAQKVSLYPNPAQDVVTIECAKPSTLNIYNSMGSLMKSIQQIVPLQQHSITDLKKGVHFISLVQDNTTLENLKLIVR